MNSPIIEHLVRHAHERGAQPAIVEEGRAVTFSELESLTRRWAAKLKTRGIGPGDPVLVYVPPSVELYAILLALWWRGAIAVFADAWTTRHRMTQVAELIEPRLFIGIDKAKILQWMNPALRCVPSQRAKLHGWSRVSDIAPESLDPQRTALVTFTTGSTGPPKGADRSHAFLMTQHHTLLDALAEPQRGPDLTTLPIFVLHALASGRTSLLAPIPPGRPAAHDPRRLYRFMQRFRPTSCQASPAVLETLLEFMQRRRLTWREPLDLHVGGAAVLPSLMRRLRHAFPTARLTAVYGSTEAEPIALEDGDALAAIPGAACRAGLPVGRPYRNIELAIAPIAADDRAATSSAADWTGRQLMPGEPGEIFVAGAHVLDRYYRGTGHIDTQNKIRLGEKIWHRTGDAGVLDTEGRLKLLGRAGESFRVGATRHFTLPWELVLKDLEGVRNAALLPGEDRPVICVETDGRDVRKSLECLELPFEFDLWLGQIPRDPRHNSKTDAKRLRAMVNQ
jgi:acyl-CoA synthetase (AMP-forming)/AMP-acid ligase II